MSAWIRRHRIFVALVAIGLVALYLGRGKLVLLAMNPLLEHRQRTDEIAALPDGLHIGLCGSGSPMPDENRKTGCVIIVAGTHLFLVDAGTGVENIESMQLPIGRIEAVFLTHFHSDHIAGLGNLCLLRWTTGSQQTPLPVHGPEGVQQVVEGFNTAYGLDSGYRTANHGPIVAPPTGAGAVAIPFSIAADQTDTVVFRAPDLEITAFTVDHDPVKPAVGYKIIYKGRSALISGDTRKNANLEAHARNVDLLVHEALSHSLMQRYADTASASGLVNLAQIYREVMDYHTSPDEAAEIAQAASVKYLLLYHIAPGLQTEALNDAFLGNAKSIFKGPLRLGHDGDFVSLPAGTNEIKLSNRLPI